MAPRLEVDPSDIIESSRTRNKSARALGIDPIGGGINSGTRQFATARANVILDSDEENDSDIICTEPTPSVITAPSSDFTNDGDDLSDEPGEPPVKRVRKGRRQTAESLLQDDVMASGPELEDAPQTSNSTNEGANQTQETEGFTITDIGDGTTTTEKVDKSADCKHFFDSPFVECNEREQTKKKWCCVLCRTKLKKRFTVVDDLTTRRMHMQSHHEGDYNAWCRKNKFESKLPRARQRRKEEAEHAAAKGQPPSGGRMQQSSIKELFANAEAITYSAAAFRTCAIDWLVRTDQPLSAFEHPEFKRMITMASKATNGVTLPNRKMTRREIMTMFKSYMIGLKKLLNSPSVPGKISATCDAWQASNTDAYFVVTAHWIEIVGPRKWELKFAIIGFIRLNASHTGTVLGRALFAVFSRLQIAHKAGPVTCDNASNNDPMCYEFSRLVFLCYSIVWDPEENRIRCLGHVVNLGAQKLISVESKSPYYDPHSPDAHLPDAGSNDVIGKVRAISVKVHSSSQRKELFLNLQKKSTQSEASTSTAVVTSGLPKVLLIDMSVRWSSTFMMTLRAFSLRNYVDDFMSEIQARESNRDKRMKLLLLDLEDSEWTYVRRFTGLLQVADDVQQAFSAHKFPSLQVALPALENLIERWQHFESLSNYAVFGDAIRAAIDKIDEYYHRTAESSTYIFAMLLDPSLKMTYFKDHWPENLQDDVLKLAKDIFRKRYNELSDAGKLDLPATSSVAKKRKREVELYSDDEDAAAPVLNSASPIMTCDAAFNSWIDSPTVTLQRDETAVDFWASRESQEHPAWVSLAFDYLAMMASAVSSERAFSSSGITISKRRNRLKGDIVEALQVLKASTRSNLSRSANAPILKMEEDMEREALEDETLGELTEEDSTIRSVSREFDILDSDDECYE